ncbi:CTP synthase [Pseudomonas sp. MF6755]|uniref:CTP synthase C-terminal region-related (seleno)protein n=1 Tax=Pseudomonas sp. MF6755 TaxID=2797530 RepID=UPI0018E8E319|nr:CTP synthase [Pseudomonas sp. MF6755]MBJ2285120.1 CTP synthase [Pseudomonas sp. MF6755]
MTTTALHLALIGDYNPDVIAHQAIPVALQQAATALDLSVHVQWLDTDTLTSTSALHGFDGFWCVPASPYRDTDGALRAIRFAREQGRPFLGTCGGFQHAVLEYARNVLGWSDAEHGELAPDAERVVIAPLSCSLVNASGTVRLAPYTRMAQAYGRLDIHEGYHCRYGINPEFADALLEGNLIPSGNDLAGDLRALELLDHPFFVATLFQPERAALKGVTPPLALALLKACLEASA